MRKKYFTELQRLMDKVEAEEAEKMSQAAGKIAETLENNAIIHLFGCGHSHLLAEEVYYRAGGLVPVHPILHPPLMLHEGAVKSSDLERKNGYAGTFMRKQDIRPEDTVIVVSTSGRNPVPIDAALIASEMGAFVIGLTSKGYSMSQPSRHHSGKRLYEVVDLAIDNHVPPGDALLSHQKSGINFGPGSTVIGAAIIHGILSEAIDVLIEKGVEPPVFKSGNLDGTDEHNQRLLERYSDRLKL
ncbi:SIS domain-containing protein [Sediminibacillus massiliensis]|uniref:SIS domain-containing protein n=1 Tax=Sediminibacillus massiliensis TaxID=1926277 RepID=UPI00098860DE|nr:SIS domain-containing protein [Sediminibacillus massiliensis]